MTDKELKEIIGVSEIPIQRQIIDYLESLDYLVIRHNAGHARHNIKLSPDGTPDLQVIMFDGLSIWIEVKQPGKTSTPKQVKRQNELRSRGQRVIEVHSLDELKRACQKGETDKPKGINEKT